MKFQQKQLILNKKIHGLLKRIRLDLKYFDFIFRVKLIIEIENPIF
jgi:hypothetical protein